MEGGCSDPDCRCGADRVYEGTVTIRRKRTRNGIASQSVKTKKYEIVVSSFGHVQDFCYF